jgi:hypothetical protein
LPIQSLVGMISRIEWFASECKVLLAVIGTA